MAAFFCQPSMKECFEKMENISASPAGNVCPNIDPVTWTTCTTECKGFVQTAFDTLGCCVPTMDAAFSAMKPTAECASYVNAENIVGDSSITATFQALGSKCGITLPTERCSSGSYLDTSPCRPVGDILSTKVTIQRDITQIVDPTKFKADFQAKFAQGLGVASSMVSVTGLAPGSVIVSTDVTKTAADINQPDPSTLTTKVADAVTAIQNDAVLNPANTAVTTSTPVVQAPPPLLSTSDSAVGTMGLPEDVYACLCPSLSKYLSHFQNLSLNLSVSIPLSLALSDSLNLF